MYYVQNYTFWMNCLIFQCMLQLLQETVVTIRSLETRVGTQKWGGAKNRKGFVYTIGNFLLICKILVQSCCRKRRFYQNLNFIFSIPMLLLIVNLTQRRITWKKQSQGRAFQIRLVLGEGWGLIVLIAFIDVGRPGLKVAAPFLGLGRPIAQNQRGLAENSAGPHSFLCASDQGCDGPELLSFCCLDFPYYDGLYTGIVSYSGPFLFGLLFIWDV